MRSTLADKYKCDDADGVVSDALLSKHEVTWNLLQLSHCGLTRKSLDATKYR